MEVAYEGQQAIHPGFAEIPEVHAGCPQVPVGAGDDGIFIELALGGVLHPYEYGFGADPAGGWVPGIEKRSEYKADAILARIGITPVSEAEEIAAHMDRWHRYQAWRKRFNERWRKQSGIRNDDALDALVINSPMLLLDQTDGEISDARDAFPIAWRRSSSGHWPDHVS